MTENKILQQIAARVEKEEEKLLAPFATRNRMAGRKTTEPGSRYRPPFAIDRDRIMYSGAFRRYTGKTQVVYFASLLDEQLTSRSLHTISVAQIAKTIGRMLSLNQDLIEAIALGHDLGHPPFGHDGEKFLSRQSQKRGLGQFHHNIQSLRTVDVITKGGQGLNLTFQTRDGIISHNGEVNDSILEPFPEKNEGHILEYIEAMESGEKVDTRPQTMEGCVVRITDTIAYIGQDIEDAIRIGLIQREDLPQAATRTLGNVNGTIIETLVNDVVTMSHGRKYVRFSEKIAAALFELKAFNYKFIYGSPRLKVNHIKIENGFELLFDHFLNDLKVQRRESEIYTHFLDTKNEKYIGENKPEMLVRDFIAGMTDRYFTQLLQKIVIPDISGFELSQG
ncbi:MAG TPA: HD domain-containing protein [Caldithrix abyssi]|uniref:HD domain-containing protein n=1 Tax=Caldithrix abyssi TaxID=187145 RepID=A0A7V5RQ61_CALAY|nr:HD domain-containing protein [Caldithrix abyssi]